MVRVPLTFIPAAPASFDAGLKSNSGQLRDELGLPTEDAAGRDADVTAVVTQRNARNEGFEIRLAKVGVSAGCAALSTVEARVDAGNQRPDLHRECTRVRLQNLLSVGHDLSSPESLRQFEAVEHADSSHASHPGGARSSCFPDRPTRSATSGHEDHDHRQRDRRAHRVADPRRGLRSHLTTDPSRRAPPVG